MFTKQPVSRVVSILLVVLLAVSVTTTLTLAQGPTETGQVLAPLAVAGTAFTYQGQLRSGGSVVNNTCDFQFGLWDALTLGAQIGVTQTVSTVSVANGLFTTPLDFGADRFNGQARWLASAVRCPAASGSYTPLTPRQPLTPAPMALALPGLYTQQNAISPNIVGGYSGNVISPTVVGGTIGGGGSINFVNRVQADYATVGGGDGNTAMGNYDTIGGGYINSASNEVATVSGGYYNTASGYIATVGGGQANTASGVRATVGGGYINIASGNYATVPGGSFNTALGAYSFAAGRRAKANHAGAFVWADSTDADFASTANDQFLIRASGGVGINTSSPIANTLTVGSNVVVRGVEIILNGRGGGQGNNGAAARALVDAGWGGSAVAGGGLYINFANDYGKVTVGSDLAVEGRVIIPTLGAAGNTSLCLNGANQVSPCSSTLRYLPGPGAAATVDSAGWVGLHSSITIGADGLGLISYYDTTNKDLKVLHCGNAGCNGGNIATTVDSAGSVGSYTSITIGADGLGLISYYDATNHTLKVLHCGNANCNSSNTATTVDSAGDVGSYTSITIGADGLGLISYYDSVPNYDLKVLHCGNVACSGGNTTTTVDSTDSVGYDTSITIGADGLGLISYLNLSKGDLKVLHCGNAACNSGNTNTTVDSTGDVGYYTSITIGADGLGLISYHDASNGDLKVFRCSNLTCTPYTRVGR